ncbi:MAG TPA: hypothetical protein VHT02_01940, partial [Methylocella sp.]|nr:hypothetical protein [Methylocella sp.]
SRVVFGARANNREQQGAVALRILLSGCGVGQPRFAGPRGTGSHRTWRMFALPHARIAGRNRFFGMFARLYKQRRSRSIPHLLSSGIRRLGAHFRQHKTPLIDQHAGADQRLKELIDQFGGCFTQTALVKRLLAVANNDVTVTGRGL